MSAQSTIKDIERKMAELKAQIDAGNAAAAPYRAELDALLKQQIELQAVVDAKVAELHAARGDPQAWVNLKHQYAVLATTRMQLIEARRKAGL